MLFEIWFPIIAGLILLVLGGESLVRGAVEIAERLGVSPLIIGLTLVGFGTSTPELVTSVRAGLAGSPGVAYGNIVGSNIANILLIGGVAAMIQPILVTRTALVRDSAVMLAVAILFFGLILVAPLGHFAGAGLFLLLLAYLGYIIIVEHRAASGGAIANKALALEMTDPALNASPKAGFPWRALAFALGGLVMVVAGGNWLVLGAVALARASGFAESVIGLSIVAVGTSLPELATSVSAAIKRQGEVAFGNIVGSNIYNILAIGGSTALIAPAHAPEDIAAIDAPIMIGASLLIVIFAATGLRINRIEGGILLACYGLYVALRLLG